MKALRFLTVSAMVAIALIFGIQSASYSLSIYFTDDPVNFTPDLIVLDNQAGDTNLTTGVITVNQSIPGTSWDINVTTGITKPVFPYTPTDPYMDLSSVNHSTGASRLIIVLSEKDFMVPGGGSATVPLSFGVGGTTVGTVDFSAFLDDNNIYLWKNPPPPFPAGVVEIGSGTTSGSPFIVTFSGSAPATGTYSLSMVADITHPRAGNTSFDAELQGKIPEPMSLILLGSGLAGVGLYRRLRKPKG